MQPEDTAGRLPPELLGVLAVLLDRLIPADDLGPGALEAGVLAYVEAALAGHSSAELPVYATGLRAVAAHATRVFGAELEALDAADQDAVVADLAAGRVNGVDRGSFFELVRRHAAEGMFGDPRWGGNRGEAGWRLLGYAGPRLAWSEEEQRIEPAGGASA